ncbi:MAG TPA: sugar ABC transporter permease [Chloroflexi bacterium]|nr:sugar ABC transporter permease [Chloroflexota bacterium]
MGSKRISLLWSYIAEGPLFRYLLIMPAAAFMALLILYPVLKGIYTSFHYVNLAQPWRGTPFVGLANYTALMKDPDFWLSFKNSILYTLGAVASQFLVGFGAALVLNRHFRGRGVVRGIVLLPWVMPGVLAALMWSWMYNAQVGVINDILLRLHLINKPIAWLANPDTAMLAVIGVAMWKGFPFFTVMLLAGLQSIPQELYEAASIDGASAWQRFRYITLPLMKEIILITTTLRIIGAFNYADLVYVLTEGGPAKATLTLPVFSFLKAYQYFDFGYSAAISVIMMLVLFAFTLLYIQLMAVHKE